MSGSLRHQLANNVYNFTDNEIALNFASSKLVNNITMTMTHQTSILMRQLKVLEDIKQLQTLPCHSFTIAALLEKYSSIIGLFSMIA